MMTGSSDALSGTSLLISSHNHNACVIKELKIAPSKKNLIVSVAAKNTQGGLVSRYSNAKNTTPTAFEYNYNSLLDTNTRKQHSASIPSPLNTKQVNIYVYAKANNTGVVENLYDTITIRE
jgi:hypothetical protein